MRKETELEEFDKLQLDRSLWKLLQRRERSTDVAEEVYTLERKFIYASVLMTEEEVTIYTKLYVENIVGVRWGEAYMLDKVGRRCNNLDEKMRDDYKTFWNNVRSFIPDFLTEEEAEWLTQNDKDGFGALKLLCYLDMNHPTAPEPSSIMSHIWYWK